jgi:hypothetical protein
VFQQVDAGRDNAAGQLAAFALRHRHAGRDALRNPSSDGRRDSESRKAARFCDQVSLSRILASTKAAIRLVNPRIALLAL